MTHLSEEDLILIYYNEPGVAAGARAHIAECHTCRAGMESLAAALSVCDQLVVPEPDRDFERSTWARLVPQLQRETRRHWLAPFFEMRFWIGAAAAAALLITAFIAGRSASHPQNSVTAGLSQQARERILAISLADHLDRAGRLLTEVSNLRETDVAGFTSERSRAQDLVNEGRLMRQWLAGQAALPLLDDVERFMMELANAPDHIDTEDIRELKQHMDTESLLFKVRIIESNLRTSGRTS
jgi:hypothetical protein